MDARKLLSNLYNIRNTDWLKSNVVVVTYVVMGCVTYFINPYYSILSVVLVCRMSSLISSIFYIKGIDKGIDLTKRARLDVIEEEKFKAKNLQHYSEKARKNLTKFEQRKKNRQ